MTALFDHPIQGRDSDERYTPQWVFTGLGIWFDLDPASPVEGGDCVQATHKFTRLEDGLNRSWSGYGNVWLNPPFSDASAWARKFIQHGDGVFLGPVANSAWCIEMMDAADRVWFVRDFAFTHPTHAGKRSSMPLFFASMGDACTAALVRLARSGRHAGVLFKQVAT